MVWRQELITSSVEAARLISDAIARMSDIQICNSTSQHYPTMGGIFLKMRGWIAGQKDAVSFLLLETGLNRNGEFCLSEISVRNQLENRKLASIMVKGALGQAYENGASLLKITGVRADGGPFWSIFGALPEIEPASLGRVIREKLDETGNDYLSDAAARKRLGEIAEIADRNAYLGWRILSQDETKFSQKHPSSLDYFKEIVFRKMMVGQRTMILPLGHKGTQEILSKRLGVLPPFPPLDTRNVYYPLVARLDGKTAEGKGPRP